MMQKRSNICGIIFPCHLCNQVFWETNKLEEHIKWHEVKDSFVSNTSPQTFDKLIVSQNNSKISSESSIFCDFCPKKFSSMDNFKEHIKCHEVKNSFVSNKSPKTLDRKTVSMKSSGKNIESNISCDLCSKTFSAKDVFKEHIKSHIGKKLFQCYRCSDSFFNGIDLKNHAKIHMNEGNFSCDVCPRKFSYFHSLKAHTSIHTGEKPFLCGQCPKVFRIKKDLTRHLRIHSGEKPHQCQQCGRTFGQRDHLKTHMRRHTGEKPFICSKCPKLFSHVSSLRSHLESHKADN